MCVCVQVALANSLYLCNSLTGDIECLLESEENNIITALRWVKEGFESQLANVGKERVDVNAAVQHFLNSWPDDVNRSG